MASIHEVVSATGLRAAIAATGSDLEGADRLLRVAFRNLEYDERMRLLADVAFDALGRGAHGLVLRAPTYLRAPVGAASEAACFVSVLAGAVRAKSRALIHGMLASWIVVRGDDPPEVVAAIWKHAGAIVESDPSDALLRQCLRRWPTREFFRAAGERRRRRKG